MMSFEKSKLDISDALWTWRLPDSDSSMSSVSVSVLSLTNQQKPVSLTHSNVQSRVFGFNAKTVRCNN